MAETDCACTVGYAEGDPRIIKRDEVECVGLAELVSGCVGFGSPAAVADVDGVAGEIWLWDGLIPVERVGSQRVVAVVAGITLLLIVM